jgi:predicted Zn-dependent protease
MIVSEETAISASKEAYVQMLQPYAREGKIDNDPALKRRVNHITGRLIAQAIKMRPETQSWEWSIKIIDDPKTVNAWAMAGGKMALYSGLVLQIKPTDDELAQVGGQGPPEFLSTYPSPANREKKLAEYVPVMMPFNWFQTCSGTRHIPLFPDLP